MIALKVILSVLLFILKVIGIILSAAVILLLLSLFLVLFVPVRYKAEGSISVNAENTENTDADNESQKHVSGDVKACISWLFHIISIRVWTEENKLHYYGKLFGKRIVDSEAPKQEKEKKKKSKKKADIAAAEDNKPEKSIKNSASDENAEENKKNINQSIVNISDKALEQKIQTNKGNENQQAEASCDSNKSLDEKLKKIYHTIYTKFEKIKFNFIKICDKIKNVNGTKEEFIAFLTTEESRDAIAEIKCRIIKILQHIKPLKLVINAVFGLSDPAATGQVYGVLCILLSRYGDKVNIKPRFTDVKKPFIAGDFKCSGRIRAAVLLIHAIKIYKIKRLKEFIAFAKGKGKRNGR